MNVVYQYVNETKQATGDKPYKYIGCKSECSIMVSDQGTNYLFNNKDARAYYGSSSNQAYWDDWERGDVFNVEILEEVPKRETIREVEQRYLTQIDAAGSPDYYNMTNNALSPSAKTMDHNAVVNKFGERYKEYAQRMSNRSKRDSNAKQCGFTSFGHMMLHIKQQLDLGRSGADISRNDLGSANRHFAKVTSRPYDLDKMQSEIERLDGDEDIVLEIRKYITLGASINKIAEILGLEIPTVRYLLGDYYFGDDMLKVTSKRHFKTNMELEVEMTKRWLAGESYRDISESYDMSHTTVKRFVDICIRRNLSPEKLV